MADDPEQQAQPETLGADAPADASAQPEGQAPSDVAAESESTDAPAAGAEAAKAEPAGAGAGADADADAEGGQQADAGEEQPAGEQRAPVPREPEEQLSPKERRRRVRSRHSGEARAPRSPEQRHAERLAERATKAQRRRARRLQERSRRAPRPAAAPSAAPAPAAASGARKVRQGIVVSNKANKTIVVRIDVARRHRRYEKIVRSSNTLHAHDESNDAREGDVVRVIESRPLSRTKRWRLVEVLERAQ
jgi:small subunit ribosomal protein S17